MAGAHVGGIVNTVFGSPGSAAQLALWPKRFPGTQVDRAYSEGLATAFAGITGAANPFAGQGNDRFRAWGCGYAAGGLGNSPGSLGGNPERNYVQTGIGRPAA